MFFVFYIQSADICVVSQLPVRVWRDVLRAGGLRVGNVNQRHGADNNRVHSGEVRRHLPPLPVAHRFQAVQGCEVHYRDMAAISVPSRATGR